VSNTPPQEIQALIDSLVKGFNTQDGELYSSVFSENGIIIDGVAPFRWLNPNAPAKWLADVDKWHEAFGVTREHLSYEMGFWKIEGAHAYAVILGTLNVTMKSGAMATTGTLALVFSKRGDQWKIDAQAWGRTS
jgi:ketosteroid isomerase-like protein